MPTSEFFDHVYEVTGTVGSTLTVDFHRVNNPNGMELQDSADATSDGMTTSPDEVLVISTSLYGPGGDRGNLVFVGFTSDGDPILQGSILGGPITLYVFSDNVYSDSGSTTFGSTAGGTYFYCFAEGTKVLMTRGTENLVEELKIGDIVQTSTGCLVPVKWIGRQTVAKLFAGPHMQPVRICAGALGGGLPHSDLTVSADHGLVIDGLVINATALINGTTIDSVPMTKLPDQMTYYHIETENHDVILANGAPAETFVDAVTRSHFDNYQEYLDLYGAERIIPEMDRPRISSQRLLPQAIKDQLGIDITRFPAVGQRTA